MYRTPRPTTVTTLLAAAAVLLVGCGTQPAPSGDAGTATTPVAPPSSAGAQPSGAAGQTVRLSYADGRADGDIGRVEVLVGSIVSLVVSGDTADAVHVHGYDRYLDVPAGGSATLTFTADVPGVFDVELHDQGLLLTQLQVNPTPR